MKTILSVLTVSCLALSPLCIAQTNDPADDWKPSVSNQQGRQYPQVNSEGRVRARIVAPQAQSVDLDFRAACKYPLTKGDDGAWDWHSPGRRTKGFTITRLVIDGAGGARSQQPLFLRREPLGQRCGSPRARSGFLRAQECAARATAPDAILFQERRRGAAAALSIPRRITTRTRPSVIRCCICSTAAAKMKRAGASRAVPDGSWTT